MGNESSRPAAYRQYFAAVRQQQAGGGIPTTILPDAALADVDPYAVLGVKPGVSWEELKASYRRTARLVHPDKGGTQQLFNLVSDAFRRLAQDFKAAEDADHRARRAASQRAHTAHTQAKPAAPPPPPIHNNKPGDFSKAFNSFFEQHRPEDLDGNDAGYGDMVAPPGGAREEVTVPRVLQSFKSQKAFNTAFEQHAVAAPPSKDIVVHEPQPLALARAVKYTELGAERPSDFTKDSVQASARRELPFTDYKAAYTSGRLFNPAEVKARESYKGLEDYKRVRSLAVERPATSEELAAREAALAAEAQREAERLRRLRARDERTAAHHARVTAAQITF